MAAFLALGHVSSLDAALPLLILQHARKKIFVSKNTKKRNIVRDKCQKLSFYFGRAGATHRREGREGRSRSRAAAHRGCRRLSRRRPRRAQESARGANVAIGAAIGSDEQMFGEE